MSPHSTTEVAILQGNATVAQLMREFLEDSDSFEVELLRGSPPGAARAQLAIIDIDNGEEAAEQWIRHCDGRQLPVIVCGVERSREAYSDRPWLSRPFTAMRLKAVCEEVLNPDSESFDGEEKPPAIDVESETREQPTVEIPGEEMSGDEPDFADAIEDASTARQSADELLDVLDIDGTGSMILEIEDVSSDRPVGGMLAKEARRRIVPAEELADANPWAEAEDTQVDTGASERTSSSIMLDEPSEVTPSNRAEVTAVSSLSDLTSNDFSGAHRVASLIAEHWDRLGLTARPADRADRLQRILAAMLRNGIDGVLDVLRRVPPVTGFSGCLETIPVVELLHTIRDRRLRGRLEVGFGGHSFVVYIDETRIDGIDSLGETTDRLFVKILRDQGALDETTYHRYRKMAGEYHGESLEMKLRQDAAIDKQALLQARKQRARYLLAKMCRGEQGTFAFIEMSRESGQSWPTQPLKLNVDALLLEIFRDEASDEEGASGSILGAELVMDTERAARLGPDALTKAERQTLDFFERGGNIDSARKSLPPAEEPVGQVVRRLERLELLRRLGKGAGEERSPAQAPPADDPHQSPTAVSSSWNLQILDEVNSDDDSFGDDGGEHSREALQEETKEDVGFSVGVPEDFEPEDHDGDEDYDIDDES